MVPAAIRQDDIDPRLASPMTTLPFGIRLGLFGSKSREAGGKPAEADDLAAEELLIEAAKADPRAFGQLFESHYETVLTYTYRCTLNLAVAEELTSNTFFKALRALPKYRRGVPFADWLYRIAIAVALASTGWAAYEAVVNRYIVEQTTVVNPDGSVTGTSTMVGSDEPGFTEEVVKQLHEQVKKAIQDGKYTFKGVKEIEGGRKVYIYLVETESGRTVGCARPEPLPEPQR